MYTQKTQPFSMTQTLGDLIFSSRSLEMLSRRVSADWLGLISEAEYVLLKTVRPHIQTT